MQRTTWMLLALVIASVSARADEEGFVSLFDGKSMAGWKVNEAIDTWKLVDGALVCHGPRSHIFYTGDQQPFTNFHLKVDVMTTPGSNAGIYFCTKFQDSGWPKAGFEAQVNNSHGDPKRTGSLYGIVDVKEAPAKDNEWFTEEVIVQGKKVTIKANGKTLVEYMEPADQKPGKDFDRVITPGTIALQGHDPKSLVKFKNIRIKKLP